MDFYLTAPDGSRIHLPVNPERITCQTGSRMQTFEVISLGEINIPRGIVPTRFTWEGFFPGEGREDAPFVSDWRSPKEIAGIISLWRVQNTKVRLLVTETPINHDCYISSFEHTWGGGHGDAQYSIELVEVRELIVLADGEHQTKQSAVLVSSTPRRPSPLPPKTYTVKPGDTLWAIAKKTLGDGSRWQAIYATNKSIIGKDPSILKPGQVIRIT